jgi:hypothetical protein
MQESGECQLKINEKDTKDRSAQLDFFVQCVSPNLQ